MRLLVFSDIHGDLRALERLMETEADCYISAGDLITWGRGLDRCASILTRRAGRVWLLPGNHGSEAMNAEFCRRFGFEDFHGRVFRAGAWHVAGLGYSNPTPFNTPGEYGEEELARRLEAFAGLEPLALICHAPPHSTPLDRIRAGVHAGSTSVRDFLDRHHPAHFICGHIHEAEGAVARLGGTSAANAGKRGVLLELPENAAV